MRRRRTPLAFVLSGLALTAPAALAAPEAPPPSAAPPTPATVYSSDRLIVQWAPGAEHRERVDARDDADVAFRTDLGDHDFQLVEVEAGQTAKDAIRELRTDPAVVVAERDSYSTPHALPNDPFFDELWGLRNTGLGIDGFSGALTSADINASSAWDQTIGTPTTVIADLDSGYRFDSPDLGPVAWDNPADPPGGGDNDGNGIVDDTHGADFVGSSANSPTVDGDPTDDNLIDGGHGIHTAGTMGAAGNDEFGITGVAQAVSIMPLRVCGYFTDPVPTPVDDSGTVCPVSSQVAAINYAREKKARVANMSLGGTSSSQVQVNAIAAAKETLFVISAANDAQDNDSVHHYPCDYTPQTQAFPPVSGAIDNIVCVAATDQADGLASFSDWGAVSVDLGAPGTEILSTYPGMEVSFHEDFETDDFAATWSKTGANGFGRASAGDGPLSSFGMNDSPNEVPAPGSVHDTTLTNGVPVPAGSGACTLRGRRYRNGGTGGSFYYQVLSDGSSAFFNSGSSTTPSFAMTPFNTAPILGLGGHSVKLRFGFTAGSGTTATTGIWFDDLEITCYKPATEPAGYRFLQGTSMAAPHVTGAAGLLFSLEPLATVTEVREALLEGVDAIPSLSGKTFTGGRLDVAKAIDSLEGDAVDNVAPAKPVLSSTVPVSPANENNPKIKGSAEAGSSVSIFKGSQCAGTPVAAGTAAELAGTGIGVAVPDNSTSQFTARATDAARNKSACSDPISYSESSGEVVVEELPPGIVEKTLRQIEVASPAATVAGPQVPTCRVPKLAGLSLAKAKAALAAAGCRLAKVSKPKARRGSKSTPLVVKSSSPPTGAKAGGGGVSLTLGPKPKRKRHR